MVRCALKSENKICEQIEQENGYKLTKCHLCHEDLCNASVILKNNLLVYLLIIVPCFLLFIKP
ncbi:hypothetical protein NQ314_013787 [Rhamnusium bicolor]|uniref:Uncharacterized protein n=1 Tax=Rhamnusium bicolor TaxID=1586634 RepID=A0AAV8X4R0_9CUCU|nr:hypothetical protein NQ314_013787 [Rhamnusium bicolor]